MGFDYYTVGGDLSSGHTGEQVDLYDITLWGHNRIKRAVDFTRILYVT